MWSNTSHRTKLSQGHRMKGGTHSHDLGDWSQRITWAQEARASQGNRVTLTTVNLNLKTNKNTIQTWAWDTCLKPQHSEDRGHCKFSNLQPGLFSKIQASHSYTMKSSVKISKSTASQPRRYMITIPTLRMQEDWVQGQPKITKGELI